MPAIRKTLWTLNIGNYAPELCQLTYPFLKIYADKIGAQFEIIDERQYPGFPAVYEKLQIHQRGKENDWNIYIDSDALIFPDMIDVTERIEKDTVCHYATDHASNRWRYDDYFRRDGRDIGSCNWFTVASDWCLDLWHPLESSNDALRDAVENIRPIISERLAGIDATHLIDDYALSRNIARYGLKVKTVLQILKEDDDKGVYAFHTHRMNLPEKIKEIRAGLERTRIGTLPEVKELSKMDLSDWLAEFGANGVRLGVRAER